MLHKYNISNFVSKYSAQNICLLALNLYAPDTNQSVQFGVHDKNNQKQVQLFTPNFTKFR